MKSKRPPGSVQEVKDKPGTWFVQVTYYVPGVDGKPEQHRFSKRVKGTQRDAEMAKLELFRKLDNADVVGVAVERTMTFGAFLETQWIPFLYSKVGENGSPVTPMSNENRLRLHVLPYPIAQVPCWEMDCLKMDQWMKALRNARPDLKEQSLANILHTVRTPCRQAVAYKLMPQDPLMGMANKPHPRPYQAHDITMEEANKLMGAFWDHPMGLPLALVLAVGLRPGEVCALRWRHFDFDAATLTTVHNVTPAIGGGLQLSQTKTEESAGTIPIPRQLMPLVARYRLARMEQNLAWGNPDALILSQRNGRPQWPSKMSKQFQKVRISLGLPYMRLYDERHATANLALDAGVDIYDVSKMMRHARIATTTKFYAKDSTGRRRAAADALGGMILPSAEARG
jgi:integrase